MCTCIDINGFPSYSLCNDLWDSSIFRFLFWCCAGPLDLAPVDQFLEAPDTPLGCGLLRSRPLCSTWPMVMARRQNVVFLGASSSP